MDKEITVQIKSPSLNEALNVDISLDATVLSLKSSIESIHPSHPSISNQRIIFSGKLLKDKDTLNEILRKVEDGVIPTFHLVVKPSLRTHSTVTPEPMITHTTTHSVPEVTPPPMPQQTQTQINAPLLPGGYQIVFINGQYYLAPVLVPQQQQQQQQQSQQQPQVQPQVQQPQEQQQQMQPQQQNPPPQQQPQIPRLPFFGLNNFLDRQANNMQQAASVWLALKLTVILFMLCQGASIERIFIFHTIAFIFFLYQTGRLRVVFHRVQAPRDAATQERPLTRLDVLKRGIYAFFASLWPSYGIDPQVAQAFENE